MTERRTLAQEALEAAIQDGQACLESGDGWRWAFPIDLTVAALVELKELRAFRKRVDQALNEGDGAYRP